MTDRRDFIKKGSLLGGILSLGGLSQLHASWLREEGAARPLPDGPIRPGDPEWPVGWMSYSPVASLEEDIADLKAHGVGLIDRDADTAEEARELLEVARRTGMKYHISTLEDVTDSAPLVEELGFEPHPARMIGGVYRGKAIDRHLFRFAPTAHRVIIEPPVYDMGFPYTRGSGGTGPQKDTVPVGHYYPDMGAPVKAEVVVPLKPYDGEQHLKVVPAEVTEAPAGAVPENDTVTPDLPSSPETEHRTLYELSFDLSGLDDAMLSKVGLAVYWEYGGSDQYWFFQNGTVSAAAESTRRALRKHVANVLRPWTRANGGAFPSDVVLAARYGDENFYITGHLNGAAVNYPLWDYSEAGIAAFRANAGSGALEPPRTWGFPEIYGPDAYAWWLYSLHESCAQLCGIVREELDRSGAPELLLFRNTTRMDVFSLANDHDGTGQELLAEHLDMVHYDPYPVRGSGYATVIPHDMSYGAGLARRYERLLLPWMQAHTYGGPDGLQHVSPEDVQRMCSEQLAHGPDAVMWLGYGRTFPNERPDSWDAAAECHARLDASPPPKPEADVAVLRPYRVWALSSLWKNGKRRNPADWLLQQFLEVWAVQHGQPYDVFEVPPSGLRPKAEAALNTYAHVVSTTPHDHASWVIDTEQTVMDTERAGAIQDRFEAEMNERGWL
jgi:hypothetical protein